MGLPAPGQREGLGLMLGRSFLYGNPPVPRAGIHDPEARCGVRVHRNTAAPAADFARATSHPPLLHPPLGAPCACRPPFAVTPPAPLFY